MKDLCIICLANEKYQRFIPMFALSVCKAYPESAVRIYFEGKLKRRTAEALEAVSAQGDLSIVTNHFSGYPTEGQPFKSLRWVLYDEFFENFKYVYLGDIDMFMCREAPSLVEFHLQRCAETALPYSNVIRPDTKRLSGLQFMITKEYFSRTAEVRAKYDLMLRSEQLRLAERGGNEELLYQMMSESVGLPPRVSLEEFGRQRPPHGIHLGLWRQLASRNPPSHWLNRDQHETFFQQFLDVEASPIGEEVLRRCRLPEVKRMKRAYHAYLKANNL
ncbi:MAG: hypothetical protein MI923_05550 [Phycisphaerales bacterium]|nr:hypothetical protein [Phycisphaerales bacterium]